MNSQARKGRGILFILVPILMVTFGTQSISYAQEANPTITASVEEPLTEANLHGSIITLTLSGATFQRGVIVINEITISDDEDATLNVSEWGLVSDTQMIIKLEFAGNIDTDATFAITLGAQTIAGYNGNPLTATLPVTAVAVEESLVASTEAPLTEATLHRSSIILTLTGRQFIDDEGDALSVSGIEGVTIERWNVDRVSDTEATIQLGFSGNIDTDATLTLTVGPDAISYDKAFTFQFPVTAVEESLVASTEAPLTEATLDGSIITLTLTGRQFTWYSEYEMSVSGIEGVTIEQWEVDRVSDTKATLELGFSGNIDTDATLTLTVGPDAIGYDKAFTFQFPVTAKVEYQLMIISGAEANVLPSDENATEETFEETLTFEEAFSDGQKGTTNSPLENPFVVEVRNQYDNPSPDVQVTFTVYEGEGLLNGESTVVEVTTDANGRAAQTLTLGPKPGINSVEVSIGNKSVTFEALGISPYQLVKISGDEQQGTLGTTLANPLVVEVRDRDNNPLPDVQVTFTVYEGGGLLNGESTVVEVTTDANGRAAQTLTLGHAATNTVDASIGYEWVEFNAAGISPEHITTLAIHEESPISVAFSPDGNTLASTDVTGVKLWDVATKENTITLAVERSGKSVAFSPDGMLLAFGAGTNIKLWNTMTNENVATLEGHGDDVVSVAFSPDGKTLASGAWDGIVKLWDVATKENIATFGGHITGILEGRFRGFHTPVSFSPDGTRLAFGAGISIKLWDMTSNENVATLEGDEDAVISIAFSPDGKTLASTSRGSFFRAVKLWDVATKENTITLEVDWGEGVATVAFSPDGTTLAFGTGHSVKLWDMTTNGDIHTLDGHEDTVFSVVFSPDGNTLASASRDGTVKLWDVSSSIIPIVPPEFLAGDVNGDGIVNIQDLVLVAANLGQAGQNTADVNSDGVVDIRDLVKVAGALGNAAAAPSLNPQVLSTLTTADVKQWLSEAQQLNLTDTASQRGIQFLEQLLAALTPKETVLLANFPNPFNPETWIPYHLAKDADVTLHIYAVNGTLVRTLALGYQAAGMYQNRSRAAYWDGRNAFGEPVASGVYFYTLTAGEFSATRKMLIRK